EHRSVIGRLVAPPPLPGLVAPGPANGAKHVAAQDPGAHAGKAAGREFVVDAGGALAGPELFLEGFRRAQPLVHRGPAHPDGLLEALVGSGAIAVDGEGEALNAQPGHGRLLKHASTTRRTSTARIDKPRRFSWGARSFLTVCAHVMRVLLEA